MPVISFHVGGIGRCSKKFYRLFYDARGYYYVKVFTYRRTPFQKTPPHATMAGLHYSYSNAASSTPRQQYFSAAASMPAFHAAHTLSPAICDERRAPRDAILH